MTTSTTHIPKVVSFIAVCGSSGVGKSKLVSTLIDELVDPRFIRIPSVTTRKRRAEVAHEERDYVFISENTFIHWEKSGKFAWSTNVGGYSYGTLKKDLDRIISSPDKTGMLVLTPDTVPILKKYIGAQHRVFSVFVTASKEIIKHRFTQHGHLSEAKARERIARCEDYEQRAKETKIAFSRIDNNHTVEEMTFQFYQHLNSFFEKHAR